MFSVRLRHALRRDLQSVVTDIVGNEMDKLRFQLLESLEQATPKLTGHASRSWAVSMPLFDGRRFVISNDADYIGVLNAGHSRQAPRNFIERTVLEFGEPSGVIVDYR